jgi:hypothetical protein
MVVEVVVVVVVVVVLVVVVVVVEDMDLVMEVEVVMEDMAVMAIMEEVVVVPLVEEEVAGAGGGVTPFGLEDGTGRIIPTGMDILVIAPAAAVIATDTAYRKPFEYNWSLMSVSNDRSGTAKLALGSNATGLITLICRITWISGLPVSTIKKNAHAVVDRCIPA